jgi:hypothetical protein
MTICSALSPCDVSRFMSNPKPASVVTVYPYLQQLSRPNSQEPNFSQKSNMIWIYITPSLKMKYFTVLNSGETYPELGQRKYPISISLKTHISDLTNTNIPPILFVRAIVSPLIETV